MLKHELKSHTTVLVDDASNWVRIHFKKIGEFYRCDLALLRDFFWTFDFTSYSSWNWSWGLHKDLTEYHMFSSNNMMILSVLNCFCKANNICATILRFRGFRYKYLQVSAIATVVPTQSLIQIPVAKICPAELEVAALLTREVTKLVLIYW